MNRVLIVSEDVTAGRQWEGADRVDGVNITRTDWNQWNVKMLTDRTADVYLFDYRHPEQVPAEIAATLATELMRQDSTEPLVFVADFNPVLQQMIQAAVGQKNITFADTAIFSKRGSLQEILLRLGSSHDLSKYQSRFQSELNNPTRGFPHLTPEVRNPQSGRLDARRVSELFAIPVKRLAIALGADAANVYKTPDAPALQTGMQLYERIARSLLSLTGSPEGLRIWLNTPEPELDNEIPRNLILNGEGEAVASLLEDMQEGQPG